MQARAQAAAPDGEVKSDDNADMAAESVEGESPNDLSAVQAAVLAVSKGEDVSAMCDRLDRLLVSDDDNRIHFRSVEGFKAVLPHLGTCTAGVLDVVTKACLNEKNVAVLRDAGPASNRHKPIKDILELLAHDDASLRSRAAVCVALFSEEGERTRGTLIDVASGHTILAYLARKSSARDDKTTTHCLRAIKCLAGETRFRASMREEKPAPIATLASYIDSSSTVGCIEDASGSLALLCNDPALRRQADKTVLGRCVQLLTMSLADHVAMNILGALLNACADEPARQHLYELVSASHPVWHLAVVCLTRCDVAGSGYCVDSTPGE